MQLLMMCLPYKDKKLYDRKRKKGLGDEINYTYNNFRKPTQKIGKYRLNC